MATEDRNRKFLAGAVFLVPVWLAAYFVLGFSRIRTTDIIPFSGWALFVFVPNQPSVYSLNFLALDGRLLDPPVSLESGTLADPHDITSNYLINHLGNALKKGDSARAASFLHLVESNVLPRRARVDWELVNLNYDPIERWNTGKVERRAVARFTTISTATSGRAAP